MHKYVVRAYFLFPGLVALLHLGSKRDMVRILKNQDLPINILEQPSAIILIKDVVAAYQSAARILGIGDLGTKAGKLISIRDYGLMCEYAIQGSSLGAALRRFFALYPLEVNGISASLSVTASKATIIQSSKSRQLFGWHHACNAEVCQFVSLIRWYAGSEWVPQRISVDYPAMFKSNEFEEFVSCPVQYGADNVSITFPTDILQLQSPPAQEPKSVIKIHDFFQQGRSKVPARPVDLVNSQIYLRLLASKTDREGLAAKLAIGTRTLQRLLHDSGTSYSQLLDNSRFARARTLLRETELPIYEIAQLLNYTYPEHFTRAFRRWSNTSPASYRKHRLMDLFPNDLLQNEYMSFRRNRSIEADIISRSFNDTL